MAGRRYCIIQRAFPKPRIPFADVRAAFDPHAEPLDVIVLQLVYLILFGLAAGIVGYIVEIVFDWAFKLLKRS
jgi:hypothetical protein